MAEATVQLLDRERLEPGETGLARLHLDAPLVVLPGDRAVLRGFANIPGHGTTLGGATVLHLASGPYRTGLKGRRLRDFVADLARADTDGAVVLLARAAGGEGVTAPALRAQSTLGPAALDGRVAPLVAADALVQVDDDPLRFLAGDVVREVADRVLEAVSAHIAADALTEGLPREEARTRLRPTLDPKAFASVLDWMARQGTVTLTREVVGLPGRTAVLAGADADLADRLLARLRDTALAAPWVADLAQDLAAPEDRVRAVVGHLHRRGDLLRVTDQFFVLAPLIAGLRDRLVAHLVAHGEITTQAFKDLAGVTRKHLIPLAEYFDQQKVTVRRGEVRVLGRGLREA